MTAIIEAPKIQPIAGLTGLLCGAVAFGLVLVHFVAGPFAPQPDTAVSLGELASQAGKSALRDMFGMEQPGPKSRPWDIDRIIPVLAIILGILAGALALFAHVRHERRAIAVGAAVFGGMAIAMQVFASVFLMVLCTIVVLAFFAMIRGIFSDFFSFDFFGG